MRYWPWYSGRLLLETSAHDCFRVVQYSYIADREYEQMRCYQSPITAVSRHQVGSAYSYLAVSSLELEQDCCPVLD